MSQEDDTHATLLARLDERVKHLEEMARDWITKDQFWAVRLIAIGLAALVLSTVVTIILARVLGR